MFCINCGKEIEEGEKYCGKCGTKVQSEACKKNEPIKIKLTHLIIVLVIIAILTTAGIFVYSNFDNIVKMFSGNEVDNEYIEEILMSGPGGGYFIEDSTKILAKTELLYQNYDKLVIYTASITDNLGTTTSGIGAIILNKEENTFYTIEINSIIYSVLEGLYGNGNYTKIEELTRILAQYIQKYGPDVMTYGQTGFSELCKEIANSVGTEKARKYVNDSFKASNTTSLNPTMLYEKNSIEAKYIAYYQQTTKYNWDVSESIANYWYKTNRSTYYNYELIYGPAYSTVYEYEVVSISTQKVVGNYSTLEKAKSSLNVEE